MSLAGRARILVVEDNALVREATCAALVSAGFDVIEACNGTEAVALARQHHPDLVLLDVVMPDLTGFEVMQRLRMDRETYDAVILILTGTRVDETSQVRALMDGADGYLIRPVSNRVLLAFIRAHLRAKQNERLAQMREQQWRDLFEVAFDGILVVARQGYILYANPLACTLLGVPVEDARGFQIDPAWLREGTQEVIYSPSGRTLEIRCKITRWDEEEAYLVVLRDVTELRATQEALRASEARFRRLAENAADLIYRYDFLPAPHFSYVNPAATVITGYTPEEHYADPDLGVKLVHPDDLPLLERLRAGSLEDMRRPAVFRWVHKDGHTIWTEQRNVPVLDETGQVIAIEGIARDITAQKQAELERERLLAQLAAQKRHLESILSAIPEGVLVLDAGGNIMLSNEAAQRLLPLLAGPEWASRPLTHLGEYPIAVLRKSPAGLGGWHEIRVRERVFEVRLQPVVSESMGQSVMVLHEVTQQHRQQLQQARQERLATVGQLAAGVAHDFNNIMTVLTLYVQSTLRMQGLTEDARENLTLVLEEIQHATHLIKQIMDFSRRSALEPRPLMLRPFIKELGKLLERTLPENIALRILYDAQDDYTVLGDPTRLQQAVLNLVFNARDAMEGRSPACLELTLGRHQGVFVCHTCGAVESERQWITLSVRDTGTGISKAIIPRLFEPFFTTKPEGKGSGMGLAQVYGIVKQHGGHIQVETQEGTGSTFTLYLPAHTEEGKAPAVAPSADARRGRGQVILVVEDHEALRKAILTALWGANYWTLEASNGREALELVQAHPNIDLILSDWVMPVMGGKALVEALQAQGSTIPVIIMTGHPVEDELQALGAQIAAWTLKPIAPDHLYALIEQALSRRL